MITVAGGVNEASNRLQRGDHFYLNSTLPSTTSILPFSGLELMLPAIPSGTERLRPHTREVTLQIPGMDHRSHFNNTTAFEISIQSRADRIESREVKEPKFSERVTLPEGGASLPCRYVDEYMPYQAVRKTELGDIEEQLEEEQFGFRKGKGMRDATGLL
ncbi:hypothetical protein ANN_14163 [Periplaneta americana]|uniref:Uncharacterized protein n=1 Tax=Periplaneta americana TaxID=6978 RepID=A0ABQ8SVJ4_PERAM|nr:hypothetical protein ANN_14163 [Periplaneta americana]